jgi:hypothetical protein
MAIEEGAWAVCVCIFYTGDGGQLMCSFLWSGRGGRDGQGNCRKSYRSNDKRSRGWVRRLRRYEDVGWGCAWGSCQ